MGVLEERTQNGRTPNGEIATLNNRGLAALTEANKVPTDAIFVSYH